MSQNNHEKYLNCGKSPCSERFSQQIIVLLIDLYVSLDYYGIFCSF